MRIATTMALAAVLQSQVSWSGEAAAARRPIHEMGARSADVSAVFDLLYDSLWARVGIDR